jgi:Mg2+ and Co2+ transporter CorA
MEPKLEVSEPLVATISSIDGVQTLEPGADLCQKVSSERFFWIDIVGGDTSMRADLLRQLGLAKTDIDWALRFGQAGRMTVGRERLRAVTWLPQIPDGLIETHFLATQKFILTLWHGNARLLEEARVHFAVRAEELEKSPYRAAAIVLQLLLGTLNQAISDLDGRLQELRAQLQKSPASMDFAALTGRIQKLQLVWSVIDRYSSAVRSAIVGVEALPEIDSEGADELNDYADQMDDVEQRLHERVKWGADIVQDYATALAQRQGDQISRLTIVSTIFLPITFLTGFFGMNFNWMIDSLGDPMAFAVFGVALPASCATATIIWFKRRGLI